MQFLANKEFHCLTHILISASLPGFCFPAATRCSKLLFVASVRLTWPVRVSETELMEEYASICTR